MTLHTDYDDLRRLVLRYGAAEVIRTVQQIECHEPVLKAERVAPIIAALEKRRPPA